MEHFAVSYTLFVLKTHAFKYRFQDKYVTLHALALSHTRST